MNSCVDEPVSTIHIDSTLLEKVEDASTGCDFMNRRLCITCDYGDVHAFEYQSSLASRNLSASSASSFSLNHGANLAM